MAQDGVSNRVSAAMGSKNVPPDCKLDGSGDFRVSSAKVYLRTGIEGTGDAINRVNALKNGDRVLTEAITNNGLGKNAAAWYYLGRINLQQGDLVGADSAFTKAEALAPACKADIKVYRYRAYAALVTAGQDLKKASQEDSSLVMYRAANQILTTLPMAHILIAETFNDRQNMDSALVYFGKAAATEPTDANQIKFRNQASFNYGVMLLEAKRPADAVTAFHRFLSFEPNDNGGKNGLARAFRAAGMVDSAKVYEAQLASAAGASGDVSEADLFDIGVKQFGDKDYKSGVETFGKILAINPNNRDALYNQASGYYNLKDGANLAASAEKLIQIEPLSETALTMRTQGYQMQKDQNNTLKAYTALQALPVDMRVDSLQPSASGVTLYGTAKGRAATDEAGKALVPKPVAITVEFLGAGGSVVSSSEVQIPALKAGEAFEVKAPATGSGVTAWRYKVK
jgi:tetratricopeptide (TPR) repeat protein